MKHLLFLLLVIGLSSCGKFCVGTFGNCGEANKKSGTGTSTSGVGGELRFHRDNPRTIKRTQSVRLVAEGGMSPYQFKILKGSGRINETTGDYTAPDSTGAEETIQVMDASPQKATTTMVLRVE